MPMLVLLLILIVSSSTSHSNNIYSKISRARLRQRPRRGPYVGGGRQVLWGAGEGSHEVLLVVMCLCSHLFSLCAILYVVVHVCLGRILIIIYKQIRKGSMTQSKLNSIIKYCKGFL